MRIAIGTDHAGWTYKDALAGELRDAGHEVMDLGTHGPESVDYPDFARPVAETVARGEAERGILLCGSAIGVSLVANKVPGIRAAVCHDCYSAHQSVEHDDVNVLCLGARVIGIELAREIVFRFVDARFSEDPRHRRRLDKLIAVERTYLKEPETA
ncbi:MAG: ribose 5-phosphate isomerase B [marine benthic group bacterium]|jgi:ribose 5-phosphate isomerase B|nr:ribose 5-phosphate isomerase B [Gemmatimonadota bacterium]MCL7936875.1 ribose 5-phosphate isomerase B [Gemmatimonadota bacterium]MCL7958498.1 ribose 5-phosphate isomerase B [Gemmatimonadota bacterium]MCL7967677.1 ribose 5-phosphate isomerase B [Gemmatimonadota bacterium]MCL7968573.1 ribose 5-phosphate isomerase B [Gemmatimonadota bacterium]